MSRGRQVERLYELLDAAGQQLGGWRNLRDSPRGLPKQGVYFFFDLQEPRSTGEGPRVVRVGTHAVSIGSSQTLSGRLGQHRGATAGANPGGGNHRGSVFRLHVGKALLARDRGSPELHLVWGRNQPSEFRPSLEEQALERAVSEYIRSLPLVWVPVADQAGTASLRAVIERGVIALLSNRRRSPLDPSSASWLGNWSSESKIRESGLWNVNHVDDTADAEFLKPLEVSIDKMRAGRPRPWA